MRPLKLEPPILGHDGTVSISSGRVAYARNGAPTDRPTLVMLHGSGFSKRVFANHLHGRLSHDRVVLSIDLPGHGASDDAKDTRKTYTVSGMADAVEEVLDALKLREVAVYGWSLGGHVAIELAARGQHVIAAAMSGSPPITRGMWAALRAFRIGIPLALATKPHFGAVEARLFARATYGSGDRETIGDLLRADGNVRRFFSRSLMAGIGHDQRRAVENCSIPICIMHGADDALIRKTYLSSLASERLYGQKIWTVESAGHAIFKDAPDHFASILAGFLGSL
jgi:pimeloyl-ACP methyl ester carboxylesterase